MPEPDPTAVGGAATINGIWFQALWIVLQTVRGELRRPLTSIELDEPNLTLEPDGGDVRIEVAGSKRIVQLKTRTHGTWSLGQVINDVLPDLYKAVDLGDVDATYEFVTEGRQGRWQPALTFFNGLGAAPSDDIDAAYDALDSTRSLGFLGGGADWRPIDQTAQGLFDRIVARMMRRRTGEPHTVEIDDLRVARRRVWHLLARFRFSGGHSPESVLREVQSALRAVCPSREDLAELAISMAGWICARSTANNATITARDLLAAHDLQDVTRLSDLLQLRTRCRTAIDVRVERLGYKPEWDVRRVPDVRSTLGINVVTGGSGEGKSWAVYSAATSAQTPAVVLLESSGNAIRDLEQAASQLWNEILGFDNVKRLENISDHLREVLGPARGDPWLTICIDRVTDADFADALNAASLDRYGVRFELGCESNVADRFAELARRAPDRISLNSVNAFGSAQLHQYLTARLGDAHASVPEDIRDVLRNPQRAGIYCELVSRPNDDRERDLPAAWHPTTEYDLVDAFWRRIESGGGAARFDGSRLRTLANQLLEGRPYPWTVEQLDAAHVDGDMVDRLISSGWLRESSDGRGIEITHDRLLGYAVAKALIERSRAASTSTSDVSEILFRCGSGKYEGRLGYALMDFFHLALFEPRLTDVASQVLALTAEQGDHQYRETLHHDLLPTLGHRAVPLLLSQLREIAESHPPYEIKPLVDGLAEALGTAGPATRKTTVLELLNDPRPRVRRAGVQLLRKCPVADAISRAWDLHLNMQADPHSYAEGEIAKYLLHDDSFAALAALAPNAAGWLERAIRDVEPNSSAAKDLAWLVAKVDDEGALWQRCKHELLRKIPGEQSASLSRNIARWRDHDEVERLQAWSRLPRGTGDESTACAAVAALSHLDPHLAIQCLAGIPSIGIHLARGWMLPRLFLQADVEIQTALNSLLTSATDPITATVVYSGLENEMDERALAFVLDLLDRSLIAALHSGSNDQVDREVRRLLTICASVGRLELLGEFERRSGSFLETNLVRYAIDVIGPRTGMEGGGRGRGAALAVLLRIGGLGFSKVLQAYLSGDDPWGRFDAVERSQRYADRDLCSAVTDAALRPVPETFTPQLLHQAAARVLAANGDFAGLLAVAQRFGLDTADVEGWLPADSQCEPTIVEAAHAGLQRGERNVAQGSLLVLAYASPELAIEPAVRLLASSTDRTNQIAGLSALRHARRADARAIAALSSYLCNPEFRRAAVHALLACGDAGKQRLIASLAEVWDDDLAIYLAEPTEGDPVSKQLAERISSGRFDRFIPNAYRSTLTGADDDLLKAVLSQCDSTVRDRLHAEAFADEGGSLWFVASKRDAIRGLAALDPPAARLAAATALADVAHRDRVLYPPLIYQLDPNAARSLFLELSKKEPDRAVLFSMAQAFESERDMSWLLDQLGHEDATVRLAASHLAIGSCASDPHIRDALQRLLDDASLEVRKAAEEALWRIRAELQGSDLLDAINEHSPPVRVACLVDAALVVGPPGYERVAAPPWILRIRDNPTVRRYPALRHWALEQIKDKRKAATEQAKRDADKARDL